MKLFNYWLMLAAFTACLQADPIWPRFRGIDGSGIGQSDFPTQFGPASNVVWKTDLPSGNSSPCIWGDRIFLTAFSDNKLEILCLDRHNGAILWRRSLAPGKIEHGAQLGHPATATPATDGSRVYVYFGAFGLACYGMDGSSVWEKPLDIPITQHGSGTSPILAGDKLILVCDEDVDSYIIAVDKETGATAWKVARPGFRRGFTTPLSYPTNAPDQVIVAGTLRMISYNLKDGTERWSISGLPNEMVSSPVCGDGLVYIAGWTAGSGVSRMPAFDALLAQGDQDHDGRLTRDEAPSGPAKQHFLYIDANKDGYLTRAEYDTIAEIFQNAQNVALAVKPEGHGDISKSNVLWRYTRGLPYCPSPLYCDGKLYFVRNGGLATCLDARTGNPAYKEERLGAIGDYYASPVAASGKICAISQAGTAVVYRIGETFEVLARNILGEPVVATPAILDNCLYVRTAAHLYAFSEKAEHRESSHGE